MNIAVITGGLSTERDVAISSGTKIKNALREKGHNVVFIDVFMGYEKECNPKELFESNADLVSFDGVTENVPDLEAVKAMREDKSDCFLGKNVVEICRFADITFFALHGGEGENGKLQAAFDILGIKYTGADYLSAALAMDKGITKALFDKHKVFNPKGEIFKADEDIYSWDVFPCVIKPCSGGSSVGVSIVEDKKDFVKAMDEAFKYETEVLVEQYIKGREFSIGVIDGKALPIIEIIPKEGFYDYVNKYQSGKTEEV